MGVVAFFAGYTSHTGWTLPSFQGGGRLLFAFEDASWKDRCGASTRQDSTWWSRLSADVIRTKMSYDYTMWIMQLSSRESHEMSLYFFLNNMKP